MPISIFDPLLFDPRLLNPKVHAALHVMRAEQKQDASQRPVIPQTDDELWHHVAHTWGVQIPRQAVCPGHVAPFTAFANAYFARDSMLVWEACVPDDSMILTDQGPVQAIDLPIGARVLGWDGTKPAWGTVAERRCAGEQPILRIKTNSATLRVTGSHRVLVYRKHRNMGPGRGNYHAVTWLGEWVTAAEVQPGDFLVQPFNSAVSSGGNIDLAELCGLLIGDGGTTKYRVWIAHHGQASYMPHYSRLCERLFGKALTPRPKQRMSVLYSIQAATLLRQLGIDGTAHTKRVPPYLWEASREERLAFLRGYLDADGSVRPEGYVEWSSVNRMLLEDIRALCLSVGLSVGRVGQRNKAGDYAVQGRAGKRSDLYALCCYHFEFGTYDQRYTWQSPTRRKDGRLVNRWRTPQAESHVRFLRVLKIEDEPSQRTWDFGVDGTNSFTADTFIVHNSRGLGGKSFMLSILGLEIATTRGGDVNILGGSGEQSRRVHDYMGRAWLKPGAPRHLLRSDPMKTVTRLAQGNTIQALLASSTSIRGSHIPTLLLDEVDEMDLAIFDAAMGQTMPIDGLPAITVMSSTHHYPTGTFTEVKKRAKSKGWTTHCWCFKESMADGGWLTPETVTQKQYETTEAMWNTEYELQEPSPESRAIMPDAVRAMFDRNLGVYEGKPREYIEAEAPQEGATYAHGADWARSQDFTEIVTFRTDVTPVRLVAYERMQRMPWPQMVGRFEARQARYGLTQGRAAHDGTGLGDVIDGYLTQEAEKVILVGRPRSDLFSNHINAIEKAELVSPYIESLFGQYLYCAVDDLYGAGHPPDGFVAGAMAWYAKSLRPKNRWLPVDG